MLEFLGKFRQEVSHRLSAKHDVLASNDEPLTVNMRSIYVSRETVLKVRAESTSAFHT